MKKTLVRLLQLEWKEMDQDDIDETRYDAAAQQIHADNCGYNELINWENLVDSYVFAKKSSYGQIIDREKLAKSLKNVQQGCEKDCCQSAEEQE